MPMASFGNPLAQSFQQSASNIVGAGVFIYSSPVAGDLTVSLWDALPTDGGNMLATGTTGAYSGWVDVFWSEVAVTPGETLFLVIESTISSMTIAGSGPFDSYSNGHGFYGSGFNAFDYEDYTFRTFANPVPVPAAVWLFASALAGLGWIRRK